MLFSPIGFLLSRDDFLSFWTVGRRPPTSDLTFFFFSFSFRLQRTFPSHNLPHTYQRRQWKSGSLLLWRTHLSQKTPCAFPPYFSLFLSDWELGDILDFPPFLCISPESRSSYSDPGPPPLLWATHRFVVFLTDWSFGPFSPTVLAMYFPFWSHVTHLSAYGVLHSTTFPIWWRRCLVEHA